MYRELTRVLPDVDALLALSPEELGLQILAIARRKHPHGKFPLSPNVDTLIRHDANPNGYANADGERAELAIAEALNWLLAEGLFVRDPGQPASFVFVSRRGHAFDEPAKLASHLAASRLLRSMLTPAIRNGVWLAFARGEYDVAVFQAMKQVEVSVREAAKEREDLVGVALARKAFAVAELEKGKVGGPLTDKTRPISEQEARQHLFAGALGSYKNPQSHRHVDLTDPDEAVEQILLANHLLRIVGSLPHRA